MMPRDTNAHGTIFGGVILCYIDQAGAIEARRQGSRFMVTVSMDKIVFHEPVFVGDLVSFWTETLRIGTTSITVEGHLSKRSAATIPQQEGRRHRSAGRLRERGKDRKPADPPAQRLPAVDERTRN